MERVGEDIWDEILRRSPVKSLCRFRCVCKRWDSLIRSAAFIKHHHSVTCLATPAHRALFLRVNGVDRYDNSYPLYRPGEAVESVRRLRFPFPEPRSMTCIDVIRGVVCVSYSRDSSFDTTILWNHSVRKYLALPWLPLPVRLPDASPSLAGLWRSQSSAMGFGYDTCSNDFKVIRVWMSCIETTRAPPPMICEVCSARDGLWRRMKTADIGIKWGQFSTSEATTSRTSCFVNGTLHWLLLRPHPKHTRSTPTVLMFDCATEKLKTMELPQQMYNIECYREAEVTENAGLLSALLHSGTAGIGKTHVDLWVMEEHGVAASWKKLFRIPNGVHPDWNHFMRYRPFFGKLYVEPPYPWPEPCYWDVEIIIEILSRYVYQHTLFLTDYTNVHNLTLNQKLKFEWTA